ncbi:MAG: TIGR02391 family protein [Pseudomonadota bacterium]
MNQEANELPDHHQYRLVMFAVDTVRFLIAALNFYIGLLERERQQFDADSLFSGFLSNETRREYRVGRDLDQAKRTRDWLEEEISRSNDPYEITFAPDHGTVRYYKSVGLLYLGMMKVRRNEFASRPNISRNLLAAIDREITRWDEKLARSGIFAKASPLPLLVEQQVSLSDDEVMTEARHQSIVAAIRPAPVIVDSIEILDAELRARCMDLFHQFQKNQQPNRYDTVVSDATRILEDRLRKVLGCETGMTGQGLASAAFGGENPRLQASGIKSEQQAVLQLFLGTFGFIRNPFQHGLIESLSAERALQILGWIDYLLAIIGQSEQKAAEGVDSPGRSAE